jgi:hypothetical protein
VQQTGRSSDAVQCYQEIDNVWVELQFGGGEGDMSNFDKCLKQAELKKHLFYDPETGIFTWLRNANNRSRLAGDKAGGLSSRGYVRMKLLGIEMLAHRLAWLYVYGDWPTLTIDHINGIRSDNRISNLRQANAIEQRANAKLNHNSTSGFRGVYFNKRRGKWRAHIQHEHLGYFETKQLAAVAYSIEFDHRFGAAFKRETI